MQHLRGAIDMIGLGTHEALLGRYVLSHPAVPWTRLWRNQCFGHIRGMVDFPQLLTVPLNRPQRRCRADQWIERPSCLSITCTLSRGSCLAHVVDTMWCQRSANELHHARHQGKTEANAQVRTKYWTCACTVLHFLMNYRDMGRLQGAIPGATALWRVSSYSGAN